MKFKVGDKVRIPTTKSVYGEIETSSIIANAKTKGQDWLVISSIQDDGVYVLNYRKKNFVSGDYFALSDLIHYKNTWKGKLQ